MAVITIVGAGMMASALSLPACDNGHTVRLVGTPLDAEIIARIEKDHFHPTMKRYIPEQVEPYPIERLEEALEGAELVIGGVSSFGLDWFCDYALARIPETIPVLSVTKGMVDLPDGSLQPYPYYLAAREAPRRHSLNAIGGPCTSYELADRRNSTVAFCGEDEALLRKLQGWMQTDYYHVSVSTDVVGVECAVAMKNAYALGVTLAVGLQEAAEGADATQAYNPQAALFGQAVREMSRLLALTGGGAENVSWAAGDLYVTIFGGRTRRLGTLLGKGLTLDEALAELAGVTLESVVIARRTVAALERMAQNGKTQLADFPLLTHIGSLLNEGARVSIPWKQFR